MHSYRMGRGTLIACLLTVALTPNLLAEETTAMHFFGKLVPPRSDFATTMTASEQEAMGQHFEYLKRLTMDKQVIIAGPVFDPTFGAVIIAAPSLEAATAIMKNDPSVLAGVNRYELQPMVLSLQAHNAPMFRYPKEQSEKKLHKTVTVVAPVTKVWSDWTTSEGITGFIAKRAAIELRIGGKYEWLFSNDAPEGQAGSEDCLVLSYLPERMLSFEWNAPPELPNARRQRTVVVMLFDEETPGETTIDFTHYGFGVGEEWDKTYDYFDRAWEFVLNRYAEFVAKK